MKRVILSTVAAGVFAVGANAELTKVNDCYQIGNFTQLKEYAAKVNGGETSACGELTANIVVNESAVIDASGRLITGSDGKRVIDEQITRWKEGDGIKDFTGSFDGKTFSISSMYAETGLFKSVGDGALLKNIHIKDVYVNETKGSIVGALVNSVSGKNVKIDGCSFNGTVATADYQNGGSYIGGLVGKVSSGSLTISNSSATGRVISADVNVSSVGLADETIKSGTNLGALVGGVESGASVTISKSSAENVMVSASEQNSQNVGGVVGGNANAEGAGVSMTEVTCGNTSGCANGTTLAEVNASLRGVTLSYNGKKLIAKLDDSVDTLIINESITVDSVVLAREFTQGVHSTVAVPFDVALTNVVGGDMCRLDSMTHNADGSLKGVAGSPEKDKVYAFYAYLIDPKGTSLAFRGPITLNPISDGGARPIDIPGSTGWKFIGVTAKKRWQAASGSNAGENAGEIGRVYGFSANVATSGEHKIAIGDFVKVGSKVTVRPMRGFIYYAAGTSNNPKPSPLGLTKSVAEDVLSVDELPERLEVIITYPTTDSQEQEEIPTEGPLALDPIKAPAAAFKADRWYDITGRNLNKPKAQGAYINNRTTVIAK